MEQGKAHDHHLETGMHRRHRRRPLRCHLGVLSVVATEAPISPHARYARAVVSFHYGKTELCCAFSIKAHDKGRTTVFCTVKSLYRAPS
jgi:hypothetical protein